MAVCALNLGQTLGAQEILDKPVVVGSIDELDRLTLNLRSKPEMRLDWDAFSQAVTYIITYVSIDGGICATANDENRMIKVLVSGRTPREIIILGHIIWLERIRQSLAETKIAVQSPNAATEEKERPLGKSLGLGHERAAREVIKRYLK